MNPKSNKELFERCWKRLETIEKSNDDGVYAKMYKQDVYELMMYIKDYVMSLPLGD